MLADLCEAVRPDMVVADGIVAMEGDGPASGTPVSYTHLDVYKRQGQAVCTVIDETVFGRKAVIEPV